MRDETLMKIVALKDKVDPEILKAVAEIVVDVFKDGIEVGMNAARKEGGRV
jgi:hypothetical protein